MSIASVVTGTVPARSVRAASVTVVSSVPPSSEPSVCPSLSTRSSSSVGRGPRPAVSVTRTAGRRHLPPRPRRRPAAGQQAATVLPPQLPPPLRWPLFPRGGPPYDGGSRPAGGRPPPRRPPPPARPGGVSGMTYQGAQVRRRGGEGVLVGLHVGVPEWPLGDVAGGELPVLLRLLQPGEEARWRCSSFETWRKNLTIVVPFRCRCRSKSLMLCSAPSRTWLPRPRGSSLRSRNSGCTLTTSTSS